MMKRRIGENVLTNIYTGTTGCIINTREFTDCNGLDYIVKLHIDGTPKTHPALACSANYQEAVGEQPGYWWNYFSDDALDKLEVDYKRLTHFF